MQSELVSFSRS